jgi:hypothetical protein
MLFFKKSLPAKHRPKLERNERVLAWALTTSDTPVIATNLGLRIAAVPTPWDRISRAVWDGSALAVTPSVVVEEREGYCVIADQEPIRLVLPNPGHLPHEVRQRVIASVRHPAHHELDGGALWLAARRVPGVNGLSWIVRYDAETDASSPEVIAETDELVQETRSKVVASAG